MKLNKYQEIKITQKMTNALVNIAQGLIIISHTIMLREGAGEI